MRESVRVLPHNVLLSFVTNHIQFPPFYQPKIITREHFIFLDKTRKYSVGYEHVPYLGSYKMAWLDNQKQANGVEN